MHGCSRRQHQARYTIMLYCHQYNRSVMFQEASGCNQQLSSARAKGTAVDLWGCNGCWNQEFLVAGPNGKPSNPHTSSLQRVSQVRHAVRVAVSRVYCRTMGYGNDGLDGWWEQKVCRRKAVPTVVPQARMGFFSWGVFGLYICTYVVRFLAGGAVSLG